MATASRASCWICTGESPSLAHPCAHATARVSIHACMHTCDSSLQIGGANHIPQHTHTHTHTLGARAHTDTQHARTHVESNPNPHRHELHSHPMQVWRYRLQRGWQSVRTVRVPAVSQHAFSARAAQQPVGVHYVCHTTPRCFRAPVTHRVACARRREHGRTSATSRHTVYRWQHACRLRCADAVARPPQPAGRLCKLPLLLRCEPHPREHGLFFTAFYGFFLIMCRARVPVCVCGGRGGGGGVAAYGRFRCSTQ
jgi:hypothetical protein